MKKFRELKPSEIVERGDLVRRLGYPAWSEVTIAMIGRSTQNFPEFEFSRCYLRLIRGGKDDEAREETSEALHSDGL